MRGRTLFPIVAAALVAALVWQTMRARDRIEAGRRLKSVEARTLAAVRAGHASSRMFDQHLAWLATAARLDPSEIGIPIARGSQFLLLQRPEPAIAAYQAALALETRPEIELNLGRAYWMQGARDKARVAFRRAVLLNPELRAVVPPGGLGPQRRR